MCAVMQGLTVHEQAMMDITPNSSSVIIAGDKCILFLVLVVTVNLLQLFRTERSFLISLCSQWTVCVLKQNGVTIY